MTKLISLGLIILSLTAGCVVAVPQTTQSGSEASAVKPDSVQSQPDTSTGEGDRTQEHSQADAHVRFVKATQSSNGTWRFDVTVEHRDTGWEDYADGWNVMLPDSTVIKANAADPFTRLLLHPHETEQPFTRSQSNLVIPEAVTQVTVRAHDLVDGWGGAVIVVDLDQTSGEGFEVSRQ